MGNGIDLTDTKTWPDPPLAGTWKEVNPPAGTKSAGKATKLGQKRLQNEKGDILRPHLPDSWHPKWHWDFKPGGNPNNGWENYTPEGDKIPNGSIYGKDFNPVLNNPFSTDKIMKQLMQFSDDMQFQQKLKQYEKDMQKYQKQKAEYDEKFEERRKQDLDHIVA